MDFQVLSKAKTDIHSIEQELSVSLPADYKAFLIEHNGICTENTIVRIEAIEEETLLNVLFGSDPQLNRALTLEYWNTEYKDDIPEGALLIGDFQDGGFLLLIPDGDYKECTTTTMPTRSNRQTMMVTRTCLPILSKHS